MLTGIWFWLASSATSIIFAAIALIVLVRLGYHREPGGRLGRRRMGSVLGLAASCYHMWETGHVFEWDGEGIPATICYYPVTPPH